MAVHMRTRLIFRHDGASALLSRSLQFLKRDYPDRRIDRDAIGHRGLHILDFFVGLHEKV